MRRSGLPSDDFPFSPVGIHGKPDVLMIDIGGSNIKLMVTGCGEEMIKTPSGPNLSAVGMCDKVRKLTEGWPYDCVSIGFPGLVRDGKPCREPLNLGGGWLGFDFDAAFGCPVRMMNDAALQGLSAYEGGRMLFVGFGTSTGCALCADGVITNVELGMMRLSNGAQYLERLTKAARRERGQEKWLRDVTEAVSLLRDLFWPDDTVIGGGNAKHLDPLPEHCRRTSNLDLLRGAERLWPGRDTYAESCGTTWVVRDTSGRPAQREETAQARL